MKRVALVAALVIATLPFPSHAAGDVDAGAIKAATCIGCHGTKGFPGMFFTLQLAGRNADKLAIKTNKYRTFKIINPMMNLVAMGLTEKDIEDISAWYSSLGAPIVINPGLPVKGDDDAPIPLQLPTLSVIPATPLR